MPREDADSQGEHRVMPEAGNGVLQLQTEGRRDGWPSAEAERGKKGFSLTGFRQLRLAATSALEF